MKPTDLRGILQYVPRFREKTFVIAVDGAVVTDENFANLLLDVAVLRSLNIRVVLVHGAAAQIQALGAERGVVPTNLDGTGITDGPTLQLALTAANRLTHEILEGLATNDLRAATPNAVIASPLGILHGVDHLFTGKVERIDTELLTTLLAAGITPVIPPLGFDGDGRTYRVTSDTIALAVATALRAAKILFLTTSDGLFHQGKLIKQILAADLRALIERRELSVEDTGRARAAAGACLQGIPRVHLINGRTDESLLAEVFSNEGVGTLIYADEFQQIRPAQKKDIRALLRLTKNSVLSDELVKRTRATIEKQLGDYYVFDIDRNPVACVALHVYPEANKGELAFLFVAPTHENQGLGKKLIQFVENKARELGLAELVTLSTQAFAYFQSKGGFSEGTPDNLPAARREKYELSGRKSKVLVKRLAR